MKTFFFALSTVVLLSALSMQPAASIIPVRSQSKPEGTWSIGIYTGSSPFRISEPPNITNPVLTPADVTDFKVNIVAHPFMAIEGSRYYLFFTAKNDLSGEVSGIGLAESNNGMQWRYSRIVLKEPFVLAYPYVFKYRNVYYMIPEAHAEKFVRLYRAAEFPYTWKYEKDLLTGDNFISASIVEYAGMWWMFVGRLGNDTLRLFYASDLMAQWKEHPLSPIVAKAPHIARPGGRAIIIDGKLYRIGQDCEPTYGNQALAFHVSEISPTAYKEDAGIPLVKATSTGWNAEAMHHVDLHQLAKDRWIAAVDGKGTITR